MIFHFILLIALIVGNCILVTQQASTPLFDGNCYCSMFRNEDNPKWDEPILVSNPQIPIPHSTDGARSCLRICIALFVASEETIGKVICNAINSDVDNLYVTVHFRLCLDERWASTKNTNKTPICCKDGRPVECQDVKHRPT